MFHIQHEKTTNFSANSFLGINKLQETLLTPELNMRS